MSDTTSVSSNICFQRNTFTSYMFILFLIILYFIFVLSKYNEKMSNVDLLRGLNKQDLEKRVNDLQNELYNCQISKDQCNSNLKTLEMSLNKPHVTQMKFLDKIYNPLYPPENIYKHGGFYSPGYDSYQQYQMIGYLSGGGQQYPVFARDKYRGRSDKQEYYTINDSRNRIKIPFQTKNWNELFDGDTINIPELGSGLVFKKYETNQVRYDPNYI